MNDRRSPVGLGSGVHPRPHFRRRALLITTWEGVVAGAMFAVTNNWFAPLLLKHLGAPDVLNAWLSVVPQALGLLVLPFIGSIAPRLGGNRRLAIGASLLLTALLLALQVPIHLGHPAGAPVAGWALACAFALVTAFSVVMTLNGPAWVAWIGGLVPRRIMGAYTTRRAQYFMLVLLTTGLLYNLLAKFLPIAAGPWGLSIIFACAAFSRIGSTLLLLRTPELAPRPRATRSAVTASQGSDGFFAFVRALPSNPTGKLLLIMGWVWVGAMMCGPYFAPYALRPLSEGGMALAPESTAYWLVMNANIAFRVLMLPVAGRLVDLIGPSAAIRMALLGITLIPVWWMTGTWPLIVLGEAVSGICWSLADAAMGVLLFSCSTDPQRRTRLVGYFQAVTFAAQLIGTLIGMTLMSYGWLPPFTASDYVGLFLVSLIIRLLPLGLSLRVLPPGRPLQPQERTALLREFLLIGPISDLGRTVRGAIWRRADEDDDD